MAPAQEYLVSRNYTRAAHKQYVAVLHIPEIPASSTLVPPQNSKTQKAKIVAEPTKS